MGTWQPIETAPKDGTRVIVAKWGWVHRSISTLEEPDGEIWHLCFACAGYFLADRRYWTDGLEQLVAPNYWMPLPEAPLPTQAQEPGE